jgi:hypothetical protein
MNKNYSTGCSEVDLQIGKTVRNLSGLGMLMSPTRIHQLLTCFEPIKSFNQNPVRVGPRSS